jgi:CheY-like chemotaxis protein
VDLLTKPIERADLLRVMWRQLVNQHERRVLVVDDDAEIQALLATGLDEDGIDVHCVGNGEEALRHLQRDTPACRPLGSADAGDERVRIPRTDAREPLS